MQGQKPCGGSRSRYFACTHPTQRFRPNAPLNLCGGERPISIELADKIILRDGEMWLISEMILYVTIAVESQFKKLPIARKKVFRGFNGIRTRGLCVHAALLYQLRRLMPQPVKPRKRFFELLRNCLNCDSTAMVTYSFHLYSRSSHHFIL